MNLLQLWKEKYEAGEICFDENLLSIKDSRSADAHDWGTVFYSQARERYKSSVSASETNTTFDLELMRRMHLADFGGLIIAANPNSLFEGHFVIYPGIKSAELTLSDLLDVIGLARQQPELAFIHNMESSAASIIDWAHYQAYRVDFPIERSKNTVLGEFGGLNVSRTSDDSPAYALVLNGGKADLIATKLLQILELLNTTENPHGKRIPVNFIWKSDRTWIIPRALNQSELAARYFGGLEMGGIFCLPNADDLRRYLPDVLRKEVHAATLACEPETQVWFEENVLRVLCETV